MISAVICLFIVVMGLCNAFSTVNDGVTLHIILMGPDITPVENH